MAELDAKTVVDAAAPSAASAVQEQKVTPPAEGAKTEDQKPVVGAEEKLPWHEDPRFKNDLNDLKTLKEIKEAHGYKDINSVREAMEAFKSVSGDPDFAAFLALKAQKERISAGQKEQKVDFSSMTAEEFAEYNRKSAEEAARKILTEEREAVHLGDKLSNDLKEYVKTVGVTEDQFKSEYAAQIVSHYEKIPASIRDQYIMNNPPVNVFKLLYFDKAKEAGVKEYKEKVEVSKKANFEEEGIGSKGKPKDAKSQFEENWSKMFGGVTEIPLSAFGKS